MSATQDLNLGIKTLKGISSKVSPGCLLHTDRGAIYTNMVFFKEAKKLNIRQSYSRKGNCWDNAVMEGWNGILKTEWLYHPDYKAKNGRLPTMEEARQGVREYVSYYNHHRIQKNWATELPFNIETR